MDIDPYWKIGPLKAEILSMYPKAEIVQYHDVLGPGKLAYLSDQANSNEHKFMVSKTSFEANPASRLGALYWHNLNSSETSGRIKKLVMKATGLTVVSKHLPSVLQIASYTPGSHFVAHPDTVSRFPILHAYHDRLLTTVITHTPSMAMT